MLAILKNNVTVEEYNEDLVAFAQTIDFTALFSHVKEVTKVDCNFHQPEIDITRGSVYICFTSDDIASQTGAFAAILKQCYFASFSNGVFRDKETGDLGYWVQVSIRYEHKDGGSNGMEVVTAQYTDANGWMFR